MHKEVRPAVEADIHHIADNLRDDDLAELRVLDTKPVRDIIMVGFRLSKKVYAWGPAGSPVALFGVTPYGSEGLIWSLSTPEVFKHWRTIHRATPAILDDLGDGFAVLTNIKDARHKQHIRWLRSLGFTFLAPKSLGPEGHLFYEFVRIQK